MVGKNPVFFGLFAFGVMIFAQGAMAAPQILGLLATKVPQPLYCEGDECAADLASFCLQPHRGEPWPGQPYQAIDGSTLTLVGTTADARELRIAAGNRVRSLEGLIKICFSVDPL